MCIRDSLRRAHRLLVGALGALLGLEVVLGVVGALDRRRDLCLLYTSDAADERSSVDLGGRRIIKKKKKNKKSVRKALTQHTNNWTH